MKKIYILWLRQIKKFFRSRSRLAGSLAQPLFFMLAFGYGFGSVFQRAGEGNYLNFLAPGIIGMTILFASIFAGLEVIWDRQFGFLKEILAAPVSRFNIMIGRTLGSATVASAQGVLVMLAAFIFGFRPSNWFAIFPAIAVMFLIALLFTSLGTIVASLLEDAQGFQLIMNFVVMPIFLLSGALFPLEGLPKVFSLITLANPLSYGIDALRGLLINGGHFSLKIDFIALSVITLFFLWLGSFFFKKIQV